MSVAIEKLEEAPAALSSAEAKPKVVSFKTEHGSVYTYDSDGKTTRFKTASGEQLERQNITVFIPLTGLEEAEYLEAYHLNEHSHTKVYVLERQPDDSPKKIRDVSEIGDPSRIYLGIIKAGKVIKTTPASLRPIVGYNAFDSCHF